MQARSWNVNFLQDQNNSINNDAVISSEMTLFSLGEEAIQQKLSI